MNITPLCTDTRCARGRLQRILNCTKMEFSGNFQGVLMGEQRSTQIGKKRGFCGVMARVITPGPAAMPLGCAYNQHLVILGAITPVPVHLWV